MRIEQNFWAVASKLLNPRRFLIFIQKFGERNEWQDEIMMFACFKSKNAPHQNYAMPKF